MSANDPSGRFIVLQGMLELRPPGKRKLMLREMIYL
jgi:hypothetical protein